MDIQSLYYTHSILFVIHFNFPTVILINQIKSINTSTNTTLIKYA